MKIPSTFVQELKSALNIVDVAGQYMKIVRKGKNHFGLCPFHGEKTPSFSVNEQLQIFNCFGCGKKGDVITLFMELENLSYPDAVCQLAERIGLRLPQVSSGDEAAYRERKFLYTVMQEAANAFSQALEGREGAMAREYLERRRIGAETIGTFGIGYASGDGFRLVNALRALGMSEKHLLEAGLARRSEKSGRLYDYFRDRVIVPIKDQQGRVVAFGGRILGDGEPKYLNTQETPIYRKGDHLFGLNLSGKGIRERNEAVLVEGYFDMIAPWQAGVTNVVASLGTSLTSGQVRLLGRYTHNVKICFDPDAAGASAALRSVEMFLGADFECAVARLPKGQDPDVFVRQQGADAMFRAIADAQPFLEYVYSRGREGMGADPTVKQKVKLLETMFPFLSHVPSPVERSKHVSNLARRLELDEGSVFRQFNHFLRTRRISAEGLERATPADLLPVEKELLLFLFHCPEMHGELLSRGVEPFTGLASGGIFRKAADLAASEAGFSLEALERALSDEERLLLHPVLAGFVRLADVEDVRGCLRTLEIRRLERRRKEIQAEIREAGSAADEERCRALIAERREIERQILEPTH